MTETSLIEKISEICTVGKSKKFHNTDDILSCLDEKKNVVGNPENVIFDDQKLEEEFLLFANKHKVQIFLYSPRHFVCFPPLIHFVPLIFTPNEYRQTIYIIFYGNKSDYWFIHLRNILSPIEYVYQYFLRVVIPDFPKTIVNISLRHLMKIPEQNKIFQKINEYCGPVSNFMNAVFTMSSLFLQQPSGQLSPKLDILAQVAMNDELVTTTQYPTFSQGNILLFRQNNTLFRGIVIHSTTFSYTVNLVNMNGQVIDKNEQIIVLKSQVIPIINTGSIVRYRRLFPNRNNSKFYKNNNNNRDYQECIGEIIGIYTSPPIRGTHPKQNFLLIENENIFGYKILEKNQSKRRYADVVIPNDIQEIISFHHFQT